MDLKSLKKVFSGKGKRKKGKPRKELEEPLSGIRAKAVIELLGAPKEYIQETIKAYITKIVKEKDLKIAQSHVAEVEPKEKLFATFAELEIIFKNPQKLIDFCFDYMPSSLEIIEPEQLTFASRVMTNLLNDMQGRLHTIDMRLKNIIAENQILSKNAHLILRNNIMLSLREKEKTLKEISKNIGIPEEKTKIFLDALVARKLIKKKGEKYSSAEHGTQKSD